MTVKEVDSDLEIERMAIRAVALDYIEAGYQGDPQRMASCLHPQLVKRRAVSEQLAGANVLHEMSADDLVNYAHSQSRRTPPQQQRKEIHILDLDGKSASVKVRMNDWIDYMHMACFSGRWVIVNVLWELKSGEAR